MPASLRLTPGRLLRGSFFLALIAWTMVAGKDVSWDVINHHLYLPFSWLSGRFRTDLFGAGSQSYQNPLGYFPIYALIRAGLPSWVIGVILSAVHALVVWPIDRIARLYWPTDAGPDLLLRALALAFCCVSPIFLIHMGTTSTDEITTLMIVWSIALTLESGSERATRPSSWRGAAVGGVLVGIATAIKLSNALMAVVLCALWLVKWLAGQSSLRRAAVFVLATSIAFLVTAGPWMWWLWQDTRNPIFPLYNDIFHSPLAPPAGMPMRFLPATPWAIVARLWQMAEYRSFVVFEGFMPDFRPLLAVIAGLGAVAALGWRSGWRRMMASDTWRSVGVQLALIDVAMYVLWMRSSGNARYAIPLFVIIGIGLVRAAQVALPYKIAKVVMLVALLLQVGNFALLGSHRMSGVAWGSEPYIDYRMSERLRTQPFLHLSIGTQTAASTALFLAPGGALSNPIGLYPIPTDGPLGARFEALLDKWHGRTRVMFAAPDAIDPADVEHVHLSIRALLYRIRLDVDWSDCEKIQLLVSHHEERDWATDQGKRPDRERELLSCAVVYRTDRDAVADAQLVVANKVFAIIEAACPRVFSPTPLASEHGIDSWQREYLSTESRISVSTHDGVNFSQFRMFDLTHFGSIDDVLNHRAPIHCPSIDFETPS